MRPPAPRALALVLLASSLPASAREPADGAEVYRDNCGRCHMPQTPGDLAPADWRAVSFHMRVKAQLTPREFEALEHFLVPDQHTPRATPGRAVDRHPEILSICTRCHDTDRIQQAVDLGRSRGEWLATLERMHEYEAPIDRADFPALADWLVRVGEQGRGAGERPAEEPSGPHGGGAHGDPGAE